MKSVTTISWKLSKFPRLLLFLALAPSALASSTWYVDGLNGNDTNDCKSAQTACKTIGQAILLSSSGDSVAVAPAIYTENVTITISLRIIGSGASTTIVDGGRKGRVFTISSQTAHVLLSKLTVRNGLASGGGGIWNSARLTINNCVIKGNSGAGGLGGGIHASGSLTINKSTISGNRSDLGGGIGTIQARLTINQSTISGNRAVDGGGMDLWGKNCTVTNSTITGNRAKKWIGGIEATGSILMINNSTISRNSAPSGSAIGHYNGHIDMQNSIVANPDGGGNCGVGRINSNGYNLSSDNTCNFRKSGDMNNTEPLLGKLGNHGGPTQTIPLLSGSPAIDAGNPNGCTDANGNLLKTDQRGYPRPDPGDTGGCDIGAYERQD